MKCCISLVYLHIETWCTVHTTLNWVKNCITSRVFAFQAHNFLKMSFQHKKVTFCFTSRPSLERFLVKNILLGILEHVVYSLLCFVSLTFIHANFSNNSKRLRISLIIRQPYQQKWNVHFHAACRNTSQLILHYLKLMSGTYFGPFTVT